MRIYAVLLIVATAASYAQTHRVIDWKPCQDITDKLKDQVDKFNTDHKDKDGFEIVAYCSYRGDPARKTLPTRHVNLTVGEVKQLHALRNIEDAAFKAMGEYEDYLYSTHHIIKPQLSDPCFYFVGIVVDTDYITVDPNPMLVSECTARE